ncbi:MAG: 2-oxoglutarate dehydrogenase E1 component [Betaproteobacteria bacterium]|nr:2-oxoglutarate dehydrogenase E1 component [Betaproteobacteria bacterium]
MMEELVGTSTLFGGNMPFIEEQYERYLADPASVGESWRAYFDKLRNGAADVAHAPVIDSFVRLAKERKAVVLVADVEMAQKEASVALMELRYRVVGNRLADVDPLGRAEKPYLPELDPKTYGLTSADMDVEFSSNLAGGPPRQKLRDLVAALRETYCGKLGAEYMHITDTEKRVWLQNRLESVRSRPNYDAAMKRHILERLTAAETLEKYLHTKYVGQKRFSGEGGEAMIPMLDHLLQRAGAQGVQESVIGMAHRARLDVLVNTFGKLPSELFAEFEGKYDTTLSAGDVKYHKGFSSDVTTPGGPMHLSLAFNPSHLEIVNPVVEGSVRARQDRRGDTAGAQVMPILIHGDAAIAGQGVVMETLNLAQTRGYRTGGTFHIIVNNQIGFTTSDPRDTRGTTYCSDVAKMIEAPIFHVNGDDPETCLLATEIAMDYRTLYKQDVVIDLVCFRRLGHNEQDEPMVTQPLMYKKINAHPGTRKLYADQLVREGVITEADAARMIEDYRAALDKGFHTNKTILSNYKPPHSIDWGSFMGRRWTDQVDTGVPPRNLKAMAKKLTDVPAGFTLHSRVAKIVADRRAMGEGKIPLDWGMAENLAYATLLDNGFGVRISGQDCARGTFFHRHAVWHDQNREKWDSGTWTPLQHVKDGQPSFEVYDSVLSEEAVLGFEYGYTTSEPNKLVVWEAQFGDFANGAQVVIDQFIASGEVKWGRICGLVLLLPHGYEGQGPEHSSARPERFLQLCAEHNMQVCVPSNAAQIFHLLRRQMVRQYRKPLIVMSPKSLLRHKDAGSPLDDLAAGRFRNVIGEVDKMTARNVRRVIFCSGKVYYDLLAYRREQKIADVAILRIEQLYPFPHDDFIAQLKKFPNARDLVWCQEEPQNQGAWYRMRAYLRDDMQKLGFPKKLFYAGRPVSASPAVGYASWHAKQQKELVEAAFGSKLTTGEIVTSI